MPSNSYMTVWAPAVLVLGTIMQFLVMPLLTTTLGWKRYVQPISDFPAYSCRKISHSLVEGCEDLYLDEKERKLYAACVDPESRTAYQPCVDRLNVSGRTGTDRFMALSIDTPGPKRDFTPVRLSVSGFQGARGSELDLHGFDVEAVDAQTLRFFVINHRPPVDSGSGALEGGSAGLNSTVEEFHLTRGSNELRWQKTFFAPDAVKTPNRVAATGEGGFVATNDHLTKTHWSRGLEGVTGGGSLAVCSAATECNLGTGNHLRVPNGLTRSAHDGLFYVPSSTDGMVRAFRLEPEVAGQPRQLTLTHEIFVGMPMDNLAVDAHGVIWAAGLPKIMDMLAGFEQPREAHPAATVFRIERRKVNKGGAETAAEKERKGKEEDSFEYHVEKVLEDRDGEVLPAATTVVHDAKTGRLFLGGVYSPFITVCERTKV